jgi:hypothetical protein
MNKKFPYGYDVNAYIDKAFEQMKELYPWAKKEMLRKNWSYAIEQVDGEPSIKVRPLSPALPESPKEGESGVAVAVIRNV